MARDDHAVPRIARIKTTADQPAHRRAPSYRAPSYKVCSGFGKASVAVFGSVVIASGTKAGSIGPSAKAGTVVISSAGRARRP